MNKWDSPDGKILQIGISTNKFEVGILKNKFDILQVRRKSVEPVPRLLKQGNISDIVVEDDTAGAD